MFGDILQPTHLLFVLVVALLVLGPKRLPEVAKSLGTGLRDFRQAISGEAPLERAAPSEPEWVDPPADRELHQQTATAPEPEPATAPPELVLTPEPATATEPVSPTQSAAATEPVSPTQSATPTEPVSPTQSATPTVPVPAASPAAATDSQSEPVA